METSTLSYQPLLRITIAVCLGIGLDRCSGLSWVIWLLALGTGGLVWLVSLRRGRLQVSSVAILFLAFAIGGFWHHANWRWVGSRDIATYCTLDSRPAVLQGLVANQPRWMTEESHFGRFAGQQDVRSRVRIKVESIRDGRQFRPVSGYVELFVDGMIDDLSVGDRVQFAANLSRIPGPTNPGQFDLAAWYRGRKTHCRTNVDSSLAIQKIGSANTSARIVSKIRSGLDEVLWKYLEEDNAALASAMLLGNREQLDRQVRDSFLLSGTIHLLAISGLHVGILASLFLLLPRLGFLSRRNGLLLTILFVWTYAWVVEFRPPVTRAAILISVYCFCRWTGRTPFSFNSLALAALVVLAINPTELFGPGAQLSFLAVGTLIFAKPWLSRAKSDDPIDRLIVRSWSPAERTLNATGNRIYQAFAVSTLVWLLAVPAVACQFHVVAPIALLANPFLLIPITFGLVCGFGVMAFGMWLPPVGSFFATGCNLSMATIRGTVSVCEQIPLGHWWTAGPPLAGVIVFYAVLLITFLCCRSQRRPGELKTLAVSLSVWCALCWMLPNHQMERKVQKRNSLSCTVMDVGHGGCVLIRLPQGQHVLYDCGSFGSPRKAWQTAAGTLWNQRVGHLDLVVISHADSDHMNGLPELAKRFSIGQVVVSEAMNTQSRTDKSTAAWLEEVRSLGIPIERVSEGDRLPIKGPTAIEVLNPPTAGFPDSDNANSLVLDIEHCHQRLLLPGDIENEGLDQLLRSTHRHYDFVMVPHHGSVNSRPDEFLAWARPRVVAVSARRGKNTELISSLSGQSCLLLHTGYDGAVQVELDESGIAVRTWNGKQWITSH